MFLTTPFSTWPSFKEATSSERCSARLSSRTARRDTTMLPRARSIFRIWKGCGEPKSGVMSRTGRMSTWLPGRNATAPERSTVNPPLTRPKITPWTRSLAWKFFSSRVQDSSRRAFSRDSCASPFLPSMRSRKTSTVSPAFNSAVRPGAANSFKGTRPSDFNPTSISTMSFSTATTRPLITVPSRPAAEPSDSSRSAAKLSLPFSLDAAVCRAALPTPELPLNCARAVRGGTARSAADRIGCRGVNPWSRRKTLGALRELAVDEPDRRLEGGVGVECRGVELECVFRPHQRRHPALPVARVTKLHVLQDALVYSGGAACLQLFESPHGSGLGAGRYEQLGGGLGADHGADVAPVQHRALGPARRVAGEIALKGQQRRAHRRDRGHQRGGVGDAFLFEPRIGELIEAHALGPGLGVLRVGRIAAGNQRLRRGGAVEQAAFEMSEAVVIGEPPRERAFARGRGTVDGDDHGVIITFWPR